MTLKRTLEFLSLLSLLNSPGSQEGEELFLSHVPMLSLMPYHRHKSKSQSAKNYELKYALFI